MTECYYKCHILYCFDKWKYLLSICNNKIYLVACGHLLVNYPWHIRALMLTHECHVNICFIWHVLNAAKWPQYCYELLRLHIPEIQTLAWGCSNRANLVHQTAPAVCVHSSWGRYWTYKMKLSETKSLFISWLCCLNHFWSDSNGLVEHRLHVTCC